jgi:hypothetical protein
VVDNNIPHNDGINETPRPHGRGVLVSGTKWLIALLLLYAPASAQFPSTMFGLATPPGSLDAFLDRIWKLSAMTLFSRASQERRELEAVLSAEITKVPGLPVISELDERRISTNKTYGLIPEVYVDIGRGYVYPQPIPEPVSFSWYRTLNDTRALLGDLSRVRGKLRALPHVKDKVMALTELTGLWLDVNASTLALSESIRYLEQWQNHLKLLLKDPKARPGELAKYQYLRFILSNSDNSIGDLREALIPRRLFKPQYLLEENKDDGTEVTIPIATDIHDKKFIAEIEGAVAIHWNQSPFARKKGLHFKLEWHRVKQDAEFAEGKISLKEHLRKFPTNMAIMTTGGLAPSVNGRAMILSPGNVTPRTLAHEIGHLIGFGDCYFRVLRGGGFTGVQVLELNNAFFPDDLMCDNNSGIAWAEKW